MSFRIYIISQLNTIFTSNIGKIMKSQRTLFKTGFIIVNENRFLHLSFFQ